MQEGHGNQLFLQRLCYPTVLLEVITSVQLARNKVRMAPHTSWWSGKICWWGNTWKPHCDSMLCHQGAHFAESALGRGIKFLPIILMLLEDCTEVTLGNFHLVRPQGRGSTGAKLRTHKIIAHQTPGISSRVPLWGICFDDTTWWSSLLGGYDSQFSQFSSSGQGTTKQVDLATTVVKTFLVKTEGNPPITQEPVKVSKTTPWWTAKVQSLEIRWA